MYIAKTLHTLSLVGLLSLPVAANARTINLFETEDGHQVVPENANPMAAEKASFAEFATLSIEEIIQMEINGKPVTVQLHIPTEDVDVGDGNDEKGDSNGYEVVVFSQEYPEGIARPDMANPDVSEVPLPAAAWLMMSGMAGMTMVARRRREHSDVAV